MRLPMRWYGITVFLLATGLVCLYVHVRIPRGQKYDVNLNLASDSIHDKRTLSSTSNQHTNPAIIKITGTLTQTVQATNTIIESTPVPEKSVANDIIQSRIVPAKSIAKDIQSTALRNHVVQTTVVTAKSVRKHIIFVVSYMRSGSTLTADILQHYPATVYAFEPLHMIARRAMEGKRLYYLDGTWKNLTVQDITVDFMKSELDKWINCRYTELDIYTLTDIYHLHFSRALRRLAVCWKQNNQTLNALKNCLPDATRACHNAKTLLFKFIRLPMQLVHDIYNTYPNLQVIHLIRDPRGSLLSQNSLGKFSWDETNQFSKAFCERVASDINVTVRLNYYDHGRAKILLYEHLATNPIETAINIYRFIHQPQSTRLLNYISNLTVKGRRNGMAFGIVRSNSTQTAFAWRDKIRLNESMLIDENCRTVYDFFGYKRFSTLQHLRDHGLHTLLPTNLSVLTI